MTYQHPMFPPRTPAARSSAADILQRQRAEAHAAIERLINFLDATEIDCDFEPCSDLESGHDVEQCDWRAA